MKNTKYTEIIGGGVILVILIVGGYFYFSKDNAGELVLPSDSFLFGGKSSSTPESVKSSTPVSGGGFISQPTNVTTLTPKKERKLSSDQSEYRSTKYKFSLFYPKNLSVQEFDEGRGASTIVFQNPEAGLGFQIFITPFSGKQITEEKFRQDVPSGVRNELRNISVDGANGASFYSTNTFLGETAEVWFIKNGFLYEITAPKSLVSWLSTIIETWLFI